MIELDQRIRQWRRSMSMRLPFHRDAVDELESHLRDAVQVEIQAGATPQAAWTEAIAKLGSLDAIAAEYSKLPRYALLQWWPTRIVLGVYAIIVLAMTWVCCSRILFENKNALLTIHFWAICLGYLAVNSMSVMTACCVVSRAFRGWTPLESEALRRTHLYTTTMSLALTICGIVFGAIWIHGKTGHYWSWDLREIGGLGVVAWCVAVLSLRYHNRHEQLGMILALLGSVLITVNYLIPIFDPNVGAASVEARSLALRAGTMTVAVLLVFCGLACVPAGRLRFRPVD